MPITEEHLPPSFGPLSERPQPQREEGGEGYGVGLSLKEIERRAIFDAIERCGGNRTKAAQLLKIDRSTLRRKLQEFGVDPKR
ncbi:MAG: hypothetical protein GY910_20895 [bacterium]|nr:hypothetical protein [bacterium]